MVARRYSGNCTVYIRWNDWGWYEGAIVARPHTGEAHRWKFSHVETPAARCRGLGAVDSPEAFDDAARAALSFSVFGPDGENGYPTADVQDAISTAIARQPDGEAWIGRSKASAEPPAWVGKAHEFAAELRYIRLGVQRDGADETDVRLQALADGTANILSGDPSYDTDHSGYWAAAILAADASDLDCAAMAEQLISDAFDEYMTDRD